jgi:hypothetical protein
MQQSSEFQQITCWQHLGDNLGDIVTDAPFVGLQSTLMNFNVGGTPAGGPILLLIELLRNGNSTPQVHLNGFSVNATVTNVGVPGAWETWMVRCPTTVKQGANTIQLFCPPGGDDFVIGNIVIFWHITDGALSSGWLHIAANKWEHIAGAGSTDYTAPHDLDRLAVNSWYNAQGSRYSEHSIVAMYIDDGHGGRQVPFRRAVTGGGKSGVVEFRFAFGTDPNFAQWYDPVVALVEGSWDRDGYIKNTYLPALKWRIVFQPMQ